MSPDAQRMVKNMLRDHGIDVDDHVDVESSVTVAHSNDEGVEKDHAFSSLAEDSSAL